jgi:hypothetical protein
MKDKLPTGKRWMLHLASGTHKGKGMKTRFGDESAKYYPALMFLLVSSLALMFIVLVSQAGMKYSLLTTVLSVLVLLTAILVGFAYFARTPTFAVCAGVIVFIGVGLRILSLIGTPTALSDVLASSVEGARLILAGRNPYTTVHHVGPSNIFAYPPLDPIFYIPFTLVDPRWAEILAGSLILLVFLVISLKTSRPESLLYLALYSFSPLLVAIIAVSTNDTSASLFPFLGAWLLMFSGNNHGKRFDVASILFGLGVVFKQFGVFPLVFTLAYLSKLRANSLRFLTISIATITAFSIPFLILSPSEFLNQVLFFHVAARSPSPHFVLWALFPEFFGTSSLVLQVLLSSVAGLFLLVRAGSWVECQMAWTTELLLFLFLGRYFAVGYFVYVIPFWILAGYALLGSHRQNARENGNRGRRSSQPLRQR